MADTARIKDLESRAAAATASAKSIMESNPTGLSTEQLTQVEAFNSEYETLMREANAAKAIYDSERLAATPKYVAPRGGDSGGIAMGSDGQDDERKHAMDIQHRAFTKSMRGHKYDLTPDEQKSLSSNVATDGGYATSEEFGNKMITKLRNRVFIRMLSQVIATASASIGFPTFDMDDSIPTSGEGRDSPEKNITDILGKTVFTPFKRARLFKVPVELVADMSFDLVSLLIDRFSILFGETEENDYLTGNGHNQALGLLSAPLPYVNIAGSTTAITAEDIVGLPYAMKSVYRTNGVYIIPRSVMKVMRMARDNSGGAKTGQFLWQPSVQAGQPSLLNGYPVYESEFFPDPYGTNAVATDPMMMFGDLSNYWIIDRTDFAVLPMMERFRDEGKIGYLCERRYDAAPVVLEAFVKLRRK